MTSDLKILIEDINFQRNKESQRQHLKEGKVFLLVICQNVEHYKNINYSQQFSSIIAIFLVFDSAEY
jgi:hypothetical protein